MPAPLPARRTLDFFAAQSRARRNTGVLVLLFALAWMATILLADAGFALAFSLDPIALLLPMTAGVTLVVLAGSAYHAVRLAAGGGDAVARMLGGRAIDRQTSDPAERRLVNVVEEMAIASGLPVPRLYVLDGESGMNAFAAGFTPERSVVAVTRGALDGLDRDELQGVVAHELSHVLNADTRLSTRLMAMVGGLTVLALVGRILLRGGGDRGKGRGGVVLGAGLSLLLAGSIGAFFGRLIRLAVSRQREFLADAAAVQFTRNPGGLARALGKIEKQGSRLSSPQALEASHLFFAEGVGGFLSSLMATHPPIEERIRRITQGETGSPSAEGPPKARPAPPRAAPVRAGDSLPASVLAAAATVGHPGPEHIERAGVILATLPPVLVERSREPLGARGVACTLLLDGDPGIRERQLLALERDPAVAAGIRPIASGVVGLDPAARLALLDLALPALDHLSPGQAGELLRDLEAVASLQVHPELFRWALRRVIERRLAPLVGGRRSAPVRIWTLEEVQVECLELLSALAWTGAADPAGAQRALEAGLVALGVPASWRLLPRGKVDAARLDRVLVRLDETAPQLKERILTACAACALADRQVIPGEGGIVRAVAASLGCPVPPLGV
jgi:Zn-dependent protease with chaperone function